MKQFQTVIHRKCKSFPKELDIESLIKQRDQIVATFIRQSWAQEIINKTLKINNNPTPKVTKPKPVASLIQTSTITLVKY